MLRIAAVDDEMHVLERFKRMIDAIDYVELCGTFESAEHLLTFLKDHRVDAVFLDIEMPLINGLELSQVLLDHHDYLEVVFMTAYNQYAVEAFEHQAIDYLLKPVSQERLCKTMNRLYKQVQKSSHQESLQPLDHRAKPFIQCVGDFEVFMGHEALTWKNSKAKEILAFLMQKKGVPVNWEKIADAIWPEYNAEKAQTNFHANMYLLRKRLADAGISYILECGRGNYRILGDQLTCDIDQIEALIHSNKVNRKEDLLLIKQLKQKGYLFASGYAWALPKAAELDELCDQLLGQLGLSDR